VYQTEDKCEGKLKSLELPADISGARVLDVGCNHGWFCREMRRRGAAHVVGIDKNLKNIEAARKYHTLPAPLLKIDFLNQHWDDPFPEGPFDYILHLSAFHYAKNPQKLLDDMHNVLAPKGVLVLQIGVDQTSSKKEWVKPDHRPDACVHPSKSLVEEELLKDFAWRFVGESVLQAGDSTPRFVYHCRRKA
jgi:2-polyprenyl-3-methyl-5-hydroxy-6-metoxy-1,4-benzoquinol methylase